jgi:hypothetical protein
MPARHPLLHRTIIPMISTRTGQPEFELIIYGFLPQDLMTVPNPVIQSLARRYPNHTSSPFVIYQAPRPRP